METLYQDIFKAFSSNPCLPEEKLARAHFERRIEELADMLASEPLILFVLNENKRHDAGSYNHMLRVGVEYDCIVNMYNRNIHNGIVGFVHDAGKMYVPKKILQKPSGLTNEELKIMKCHNMLSMTVLKELEPKYPGLTAIALAHHLYPRTGSERRGRERRDIVFDLHFERRGGTDRRNGDRRKQNSVARFAGEILTICDIFDALSSPRTYKTAWSNSQIREEIERKFGAHKDSINSLCIIFSK